jgi:N-acetylglucosamine-6-phosphate deacetylase
MKIPGLVDLQVHGFMGVDFSSAKLTEDDFAKACRGILDAGTTAFLPTIITSPSQVYQKNLAVMANVMQTKEFRNRVLGIHLEGPFISPEYGARGEHNPQWITKPDIEYLRRLNSWADETIKLVTIAAEIENAEQLTQFAVDNGIAVSLGHQLAEQQDLAKLARAGAGALTHLGNGIPEVLPKHDNPIWAGLANDNLWAMIITDGHHLPPEVLKTFIRTKGATRCIVVSNGSSLANLPPGRYNALGNDVIVDESGRIYNPETDCLVGFSATMLQCMNYLASLNLLAIEELLAVGFFNPLKLIAVNPNSIRTETGIIFDEEKKLFNLDKND